MGGGRSQSVVTGSGCRQVTEEEEEWRQEGKGKAERDGEEVGKVRAARRKQKEK